MPDDPIIYAPVDKFFNTDLNNQLQQAGIKTAVVSGTYANGAVLYTAMELNLRGYTVVVAQDGSPRPLTSTHGWRHTSYSMNQPFGIMLRTFR